MERCYRIVLLIVGLVRISQPLPHNSSLLIRKCCANGEDLSMDYGFPHCVTKENRKTSAKDPQIQSVDSLLRDMDMDFPWWMDSTVLPLSSATLDTVQSFLKRQESGKYIEYGGGPPCALDQSKILLSNSDQYSLLDNGSVLYHPSGLLFPPHSYCTDSLKVADDRTGFVYILCPCRLVQCVRKCCPFSSILQVRANTVAACVQKGGLQDWKPEFYYNSTGKLKIARHHVIQNKWPDCGSGRQAVVLSASPRGVLSFWIAGNGSVVVEHAGGTLLYPAEDYCVDMSELEDGASLLLNLVACGDVKEEPRGDATFYGTLFVVGAVFLAVTLLVFLLLPEVRSRHGNVIVAQAAGLLPSYVFLAVGQLQRHTPPKLCLAQAFIIQFSFLAAFFWLNVMCIDISWAFSGFRPPQGSVTERDRKKFLYYSLYAWGSPTVITIVTAIMEFVKEIPDTYLKPDFAIKSCWFKEKSAAFAYFYGPMAVLLLANFVLFVYTTVKIIRVQRDTRILHNGESGRHDGSNFKKDKKRLILYAKLFCLMGLTWVTEIISWLHGSPQYYWYVTDAINLLRAVFIFVIFCCKRKVFRLLKQRLFPSLTTQNTISQSNGTRKSSGSSTQNSSLPSMQMTQIKRSTKGEKSTPGNP